MFGSVISSVWRLMRGSAAPNPFEPPLMQIARRLHQQRVQLTQQQGGQPQPMTQQPLQQAEQPMTQPAQPMQPWQPMQPGQMPSFGPYDQNQFMQSLLGGFTRSMFRRPWSFGQPGQQMPSQTSLAQVLMRLLGG
jgi:hypothetical protein